MARRIERFQRLYPRYPWSQWSDGACWRVRKGLDFRCSVICFRSVLHRTAARRKKKVRVSSDGKYVHFQFYEAGTPPPDLRRKG